MTVITFDSITEIDRERWNALIPDSDIQHRHEFYLTLESSKLDNFTFRYITVFDGDRLAAVMPLFLTDNFYIDIPLMGTFKKITSFFKRIFPGFLRIKVLFCGNPVSEYNSFMIDKNYDRLEVIGLILDEFTRTAKTEGIKYTAFKDYRDITPEIKKLIKSYGFSHVYSMPGTYIIHDVKNFDDYLKTLNKKNRHNIRNKINKVKDNSSITVEVTDDFAQIADDLYRLYENTYNKAIGKFEKLNRDFFYNIGMNLRSNVRALIVRYDGKIIGFTLLVFSAGSCINMRMGLDYDYAYEYHTYFLILFENLKFIFDSNIKTLFLSQSTYRPKLELGAGIQVLDAFVRNRNPVFNFLMGKLCFLIYIKYRILSKCSEPHKKLKKLFPQLFSG